MNGANAPGIDPALQEDMERGIAAAQAGDKATAHRIFQSIAVRHADIADIWVWVGGTSPTLDEAEAAFERASMLDPNNEEAKLGLRWASLRRQATGAPARSTGPMSPDTLTSPNFDTGTFGGAPVTGGLTQGAPQPSVPFGPAQPSPDAPAEATAEAPAEAPAPAPAKRGGLSVAAIIMILAIIVLAGVFFWLMYMQ